MKRSVITVLTLGCLVFDAECGIFSGNPLKRAERFVRKEAISTMKQEVRNAGKTIERGTRNVANAVVKAHDEIDRVVEKQVIPAIEETVKAVGEESRRVEKNVRKYVKEEVAPTMKQVVSDVRTGVENTGKAIGNGIVSAHNETDKFVENTVIPGAEKGIDVLSREGGRVLNQAEDKARRLGNFAQKAGKDVEGEFRRAKKEINRFIDENKRTLSDSAVEHLKDKSPTVSVITKVDDFIKQHPIFTCSATMIAIAGVLRVSAENFSDLFQFLNKFTQKIFD